MTARKTRKIMGLTPFKGFKDSKGLGSQLVDLMLELLDFAFQDDAGTQGAGQGEPLPLNRNQALKGIEQDILHAR
jgi:hypothetical protein